MKFFLPAVFCMAIAAHAFAQNMDHRNAFSVQVGANLFNFVNFAEADYTGNDGATLQYDAVSGSSIPTIQISYDRAMRKWFSIGGAVAYNAFKVEFTNLDYTGPDGERLTGDGGFKFGRTSINVRPLFHYGKSDKLDLYSGFRIGLSIWNVGASGNLQGENADGQVENFGLSGIRGAGVLPQGALTLFGMRGFFTDNLGAGFEVNLGSPYLFSGGLTYRF